MSERIFKVVASDHPRCRAISGPDGIFCPMVPETLALYFASLMDLAYEAGRKAEKAATTTGAEA